MVAAVVAEKPVRFPVDDEPALFDAVAETADQRAEITAVVFVPGDIVVTEDDVDEVSVFIGDLERLDDAAEIEDDRFVFAVFQREGVYVLPFRRFSEKSCMDHTVFLLYCIRLFISKVRPGRYGLHRAF